MNQAKELTERFLAEAAPEVRGLLAGSVPLEEYLRGAGDLTLDERRTLVQQALVLFEQNYVHLPPKIALYAVNPVQALRLLQIRLDRQTDESMDPELDFHSTLAAIFHSVRDLHTSYVLPARFNKKMAYLPLLIEEYYEGEARHYVVSHLAQGFSAEGMTQGAEITHWNGVPIDRAVARNAARHGGSNAAARHQRGLESLTVRPLKKQLPPDELWVVIGFTGTDGTQREVRVEWLVADSAAELPSFADPAETANANLGIDIDGYATGLAKTVLFAPAALGAQDTDDPLRSTMPTVFRARIAKTKNGDFGHLRIFTFMVNDHAGFTAEFVRLIGLLPQNGLIIDVRDNGGGHIWASEGTLQTLTPKRITPSPTEFINLPLNLRICRKYQASPELPLGPWFESLERNRELGAPFSEGYPITPTAYANRLGQRYHGPVVLITNARCYSATDFFAAGFADHGIGMILGTDPNTGAGGANVWAHSFLTARLAGEPDSPYRPLPGGAEMNVAIRRGTRVGAKSGVQLEDLGVVPDELHLMTRNDVLEGNTDLLDHAGRLLASMPTRDLEVTATSVGSSVRVHIEASGVERAVVWLDEQPRATAVLTGGTTTLMVDDATDATSVRIEGYAGKELVAARLVEVSPQTLVIPDQATTPV